MNSFDVVDKFEREIAKFAGAQYCVAVNSCTNALFLALRYVLTQTTRKGGAVKLPAHTFVSVPMAVIQAGARVEFVDYLWGGVYPLAPHDIWDGALRFRRGMYEGGLHCLSFHARKLLNIGEGGAILTNDLETANWLRAARYSGRTAPAYRIEDVTTMGFQMYMTPEKAARGLHLMEYIPDDLPDQVMEYPDLRTCKAFQ